MSASALPAATYYVDASVLVKRHVREVGSGWLRSLVDPSAGNVVVTAQLSIIEVSSAFNRRRRESRLSLTDYASISADFFRVVQNEYEIVFLSAAIISRARTLLERHSPRAGDAVQLASALADDDDLRAAGLARLTFLCSDDPLLVAAQAEGFATDDPRLHT